MFWKKQSIEGNSPVYYNYIMQYQVKWRKFCLKIGEPSSKAKYVCLAIVKSTVRER